jgi:uncharacterized membrane protein YccF (DUF307 family)
MQQDYKDYLPKREGRMSTSEEKSPSKPKIVVKKTKGPGCLIQALWFIFIGWWLGIIVIGIAWFLNITIIGLPLGLSLLNNIPKVLTLREGETRISAITRGDTTIISEIDLPQRNFFLRAAYFLLIGWWWSGIWLAIAYSFCAVIILMHIGFKMFELTPAMTTLRRY